ncbi:HAD family hydrolase [Sphaerisporangium corydalis]|uniref:HAD family hydrolase n=1 Tax=Sphaerisporangium corydalis TaxID=1441875 RepID=A0ABV9EQ99_9ACTN|nr:HAD hydrolase-like protein [Sphaerisporangium corydalis]
MALAPKVIQNQHSRVVDTGVEGVRKPDIRLFKVAAQRCGLPLEGGGWMVGDNLLADIGGGQEAGLRTIWIDRGVWVGHDHSADHVATDVLQAIEIIECHA